MRSVFVVTFYLLIIWSVQAQFKLSESAEISVITCGPGQNEVYSAFGHSAFRVYDPVNQFDGAFNYGVFDFNQPNFYLNFARGRNNYRLAVQDYQRFEYAYVFYNRYVHEQVLNLTQTQKQLLFDYLTWNAQPENQYYRYDYFYDNCATKLPEIVSKVFGDSVVFDGSYIQTNYSIRELTDLYLKWQPWGDLGIDLCLGIPMDKIATPYEYMFLPDFVESGFDHAFLKGKPLVKEKRIIHQPAHEEFSNSVFQPRYVFSLIAFIIALVTVFDMKQKRLTRWLDVTLFGITGFLGVFLLLLWFATDHKAAAWNMNLLWALPTNLIAAVALLKGRSWTRSYFLVVLIISALLLIGWSWMLPQKLHFSLIPVVAAIALRAYFRYRRSDW